MQQFVSVTFMFIYLFHILCLDLCIVIYSTQKLKKKEWSSPGRLMRNISKSIEFCRWQNYCNCGHRMHFVWKQWKVIRSLLYLYFAI